MYVGLHPSLPGCWAGRTPHYTQPLAWGPRSSLLPAWEGPLGSRRRPWWWWSQMGAVAAPWGWDPAFGEAGPPAGGDEGAAGPRGHPYWALPWTAEVALLHSPHQLPELWSRGSHGLEQAPMWSTPQGPWYNTPTWPKLPPAPPGETTVFTSAGTPPTAAALWRGRRERSSCASRAVSWQFPNSRSLRHSTLHPAIKSQSWRNASTLLFFKRPHTSVRGTEIRKLGAGGG